MRHVRIAVGCEDQFDADRFFEQASIRFLTLPFLSTGPVQQPIQPIQPLAPRLFRFRQYIPSLSIHIRTCSERCSHISGLVGGQRSAGTADARMQYLEEPGLPCLNTLSCPGSWLLTAGLGSLVLLAHLPPDVDHQRRVQVGSP
jgi:hypothetical protein